MAHATTDKEIVIHSKRHWNWSLWRRWVLANTVGEIVGLGLAAVVGIWFVLNYEKDQTTTTILLPVILMIAVGYI